MVVLAWVCIVAWFFTFTLGFAGVICLLEDWDNSRNTEGSWLLIGIAVVCYIVAYFTGPYLETVHRADQAESKVAAYEARVEYEMEQIEIRREAERRFLLEKSK